MKIRTRIMGCSIFDKLPPKSEGFATPLSDFVRFCLQQKNTENGAAVTSLRSFLFRDDFSMYFADKNLSRTVVCNSITKKEPKSDNHLSKFDWHDLLSPIFWS